MDIKVLFYVVLFFLSSLSHAVIIPDKTTRVVLSNRDVNRIVCQNGQVSDVNFSSEKGLDVKVQEDNVFVKFQVLFDGERKKFIQDATEVYITCHQEVFSLVIEPKEVDAKTIYLGRSIKDRAKKNLLLYQPLKLEEKVIDMTLRAIKDDLPESFSVHKYNKRDWRDDCVQGLRIAKVRDVLPEGLGLKLTEYIVFSLYDLETQLDETDFLETCLVKQPLGITVNPTVIVSGGISRLYIVSRHVSEK